ncbi:glutaminyl-peptide cyclotransferase [Streptomyces sp. NPDC051940]|uniref:glutaminyl-peptide cyclotransferase n=1 Tax=Streptomyces sp. NPDC051940 TaxID=3155675 RepID=UPI00343F2986
MRAEVRETLPHDTSSFTQGLELKDGVLYEGTGRRGRSALYAGSPGAPPIRAVALPADLFGEGITLVGDRVWQLTWQEGVALERDARTLKELRRVRYDGEGWGLCLQSSAERLVMSDGSATLTFRDPKTFAVRGTLPVTESGSPLARLNELECAPDGRTVYANVWQTDRIVRIDTATGEVTATIDASGLLTPAERTAGADVLNGIAAIPHTDEFYVTGKLWPKLFRVRFVPEG